MKASLKRERTALSVALALAMGSAGLSIPDAIAQDAQTGGFSLPAGTPAQQTPPADVQGPVDSESNPPRRTDQPADPAPGASLPSIAPVPVPTPQQRAGSSQRDRAASRREQRAESPAAIAPTAPPEGDPSADRAAESQAPVDQTPPTPPPAGRALPGEPAPTPLPETGADAAQDDGSIWLWLAAGLVALISLIAMALRQRAAAREAALPAAAPVAPAPTVPTPPLRASPLGAAPASSLTSSTPRDSGPRDDASPAPAAAQASDPHESAPDRPSDREPVPAPAATPAPPATPAAPATTPMAEPTQGPPRLLLDFSALGVDVTLINAIARYHLGITNMADIPVSDVALHGTVVQARREMPPTIDPMRGDSLLPLLQAVPDIAPDQTRRCEGQIRLPLSQIEPIEMQGRMLFVPVVHIWIGYTGPDGTRYAVTQSFVLGEESSPPGPRVGPLRLDLGPRRFTDVGQRPLQPA